MNKETTFKETVLEPSIKLIKYTLIITIILFSLLIFSSSVLGDCEFCTETCSPCGGGCNPIDIGYMYSDYDFDTDVDGVGDITGWNTFCIIAMYGLFSNSNFNQDISNWDTSNVQDMSYMFSASLITPPSTLFNQNINSWNVSSVDSFFSMFDSNTVFNQPLNNWNTSGAENMGYMFSNTQSFNQSINNFDTSNVTIMEGMFYNTYNFTQPINNFDTGNVQDMDIMFQGSKFDDYLGNWNFTNLITAVDMFYTANLSNYNYDTLLQALNNTHTNTGVTFHGGYSKYTLNGSSYRNSLVNDAWIINDGGLFSECTENWEQYNTTCNGSDYEILYNDMNTCGTIINLPVDNGTLITCSYGTYSPFAYNKTTNGYVCGFGECPYININYTSDGNINNYGYNDMYYEPEFVHLFFKVNPILENKLIVNFYHRTGNNSGDLYYTSSEIYLYNYDTDTLNYYSFFGVLNDSLQNFSFLIEPPYINETGEVYAVITNVKYPYSDSDNIVGLRDVYIQDNESIIIMNLNPCNTTITNNDTGVYLYYSFDTEAEINYSLYINDNLLKYYLTSNNNTVRIPSLPTGIYNYTLYYGNNESMNLDCHLSICNNNWIRENNYCNNSLTLRTYRDNNNCAEKYNIPSDNGTLQECTIPPPTDKELWFIIILLGLWILGIGLSFRYTPLIMIPVFLLATALSYYTASYFDNPLIAVGIMIITAFMFFISLGIKKFRSG